MSMKLTPAAMAGTVRCHAEVELMRDLEGWWRRRESNPIQADQLTG
jgi:hypothetical protein